MFHAAGDHMVACVQKTRQDDIQRFGGIFGKNDSGRIGNIEQFRQTLTGVQNDLSGSDSFDMSGTPGIAAFVREKILHGLHHDAWFGPGGCGVVKIIIFHDGYFLRSAIRSMFEIQD